LLSGGPIGSSAPRSRHGRKRERWLAAIQQQLAELEFRWKPGGR
jgi:hypothetical protein